MNQNYLLPVSIVIAGALIGAALFYGGNVGQQLQEDPVPVEEVSEIDVVLDAPDYQYLGDPEAPVTMIEYADFACPFCHRHWRETFSLIKEQYVDTGIVQYVYRDFPVVGGEQAALASHCAAEQGKYWEYHDLLFQMHESDRGAWGNSETHREYADSLGLNADDLVQCFEEGRYQSVIEDSFEEAVANLGNGTPYFLVNGIPVGGAVPFEVFQEVIEVALERAQVEGE